MSKFRKDYMERREPTRTKPQGETLTDQSQRQDCDLNVIVKKHMPGTVVAGGSKQPIFGADLAEIPTDLAEAIQAVRKMGELRGRLPEEFKNLAIEDLLELTPETIQKTLTPAPKPEE